MKVIGRIRTPQGRIVKLGSGADAAGAGGEGRSGRMTPASELLSPPQIATEEPEVDRDPWWFLRALAQEAFQKHF